MLLFIIAEENVGMRRQERERMNKDWKRERLEGVAMSTKPFLPGTIGTSLKCQKEK